LIGTPSNTEVRTFRKRVAFIHSQDGKKDNPVDATLVAVIRNLPSWY
jgi:hypothetical protein